MVGFRSGGLRVLEGGWGDLGFEVRFDGAGFLVVKMSRDVDTVIRIFFERVIGSVGEG